MQIRPINSEIGPIENHSFYKCIQPLIILQKVTGGWIHRPIETSGGKLKHNAFLVHCVLLELITTVALLRVVFFFTDDVSLQTSEMYIYLVISLYVAVGSGQIMSIFKYSKILQFWDGLFSRCLQDLNGTLKRSRAAIQMMVIILVSLLVISTGFTCYVIARPKADPLLLWLAQPWSDSQAPQLIVLATLLGFMPSIGSWFSATLLFLVAGYYLCTGFKNLYRTMEVDQHLMTELATYKMQHMHLSQLTTLLDDILRGYIGPTVGMSTFMFCLVIFTLEDNHGFVEMMTSITALTIASSGMAIIFAVSIFVSEWVSGKFKCKWLHIAWLAMFDLVDALAHLMPCKITVCGSVQKDPFQCSNNWSL